MGISDIAEALCSIISISINNFQPHDTMWYTLQDDHQINPHHQNKVSSTRASQFLQLYLVAISKNHLFTFAHTSGRPNSVYMTYSNTPPCYAYRNFSAPWLFCGCVNNYVIAYFNIHALIGWLYTIGIAHSLAWEQSNGRPFRAVFSRCSVPNLCK